MVANEVIFSSAESKDKLLDILKYNLSVFERALDYAKDAEKKRKSIYIDQCDDPTNVSIAYRISGAGKHGEEMLQAIAECQRYIRIIEELEGETIVLPIESPYIVRASLDNIMHSIRQAEETFMRIYERDKVIK